MSGRFVAMRKAAVRGVARGMAGGAAPAPGAVAEEETAKALDGVWNVVVYNDPVNLMSYVTHVFMKVFGYPEHVARRHMLEVHHKGRSILWSGGRERAELYVQELHAHLLLAALERAEV